MLDTILPGQQTETIIIGDNEAVTIDVDITAPVGLPAVDISGNEATLTVTETGSIDAPDTGNTAVVASGSESTVINDGSISGALNGITSGGDAFNIDNNGTISSDSRAIDITDGDNQNVTNSGDILGTDDQRNGTLYINGTVDGATVINEETGIIDAGENNNGDGIVVQVGSAAEDTTSEDIQIVNAGTIAGRGQPTIPEGANGSSGVRFFNGSWEGEATITGSLTNSGSITSEAESSVFGGVVVQDSVAFDGIITNEADGTIQGVQNGLYIGNANHDLVIDNKGTITSSSRAVNLDGNSVDLFNSGEIRGIDSQRNGTLYIDGTSNDISVNNLESGVIDAGEDNSGSGISIQVGTVDEFGVYVDDFDAVSTSANLTNAGTIQGRGTDNVPVGVRLFLNPSLKEATFEGDIVNEATGSIASETSAGILIESGVTFDGEIVNQGAISGGNGIAIDAAGTTAGITISNSGTLNGSVLLGSGDDTFVQDSAELASVLNGGEGIDTIDFSGQAEGIVVDLDLDPLTPGPATQNGILLETQNGALLDVPNGNVLTELVDFENVIGSDFDDLIFGNNEDNDLSGGAGNDAIYSFAGEDTIDGGEGIDTALFTVSAGVEVNLDNNGDAISSLGDTLLSIENINGSTAGDDTLSGNAFSNILNGEGGNDILDGEGGDDTLIGGTGNDTLIGGAGNDSLVSDGLDAVDGDIGIDTIDLSTSAAGVVIDLDINTPGPTNTQTGAILDAPGGNVLADIIDVENVIGTDFNDVILGNNELNDLAGGLGNDTIHSFAGADTINGGEDIDTVLFSAGGGVTVDLDETGGAISSFGDTLISIENINGSVIGDDSIGGNSLANVLNGQGGNDTLDGEGGIDTLIGGEGNDLLLSDGVDVVDGGLGNDTIDFSSAAGGIVIDLDLNTPTPGPASENGAILDAPGGTTLATVTDVENVVGSNFDDLILGNNDINNLAGGLGNDTIHSFAGADTLNGGAGIDTALFTAGGGVEVNLNATGGAVSSLGDTLISIENINGADAGNDTLSGNGLTNTLNGQGGNDILNGEGGSDTLIGGGGTDSLSGGSGTDELFGNGGSDTLLGGSGADSLFGGDGGDLLFGNSGADLIRGNAGADILNGGSGSDTLNGGSGSDILNGGGSADSLFGGSGADTLLGDNGIDVLTGNSGNDNLFGGNGADTLNGGSGVDILNGGSGADILNGGSGADILNGGSGADLLSGNDGADTLTGNGGSDIFLITNNGVELVTDFQDGNDLLGLEGLGVGAVQAVSIGNDTLIEVTSSGQNLAILQGIDANDITAADFTVNIPG